MSSDPSPCVAVRDACVAAAVAAYEDAGIRGLCHEGRWECALAAMRALDPGAVPVDSPRSAAPEASG